MSGQAFGVFDSLTDKQHQTLALAATHLTSKQIALELGVSPVTIDKRIEALRARLGHVARSDLLRLYLQWCQTHDRSVHDPIILAGAGEMATFSIEQPVDPAFVFEDSITFDARASWERQNGGLLPELKLSELGVWGKLCVIFGGAVAIMIVAVLCIAFADALMSILER